MIRHSCYIWIREPCWQPHWCLCFWLKSIYPWHALLLVDPKNEIRTYLGLNSFFTQEYQKNSDIDCLEQPWLFIWQITLSQFYNVSFGFKSASSGNKLQHLEDGLIIFFLLPMRSVSVSAFFALGFVSPLVAAQVSAWGQCEYRE